MNARKSMLAGLASLCALLGALLSSAPALALAPEAPVAKEAKPVFATTATLHGELNPGVAGESGEYEFLYNAAPATNCTGGKTAPIPAGIALGSEKEQVSVRLTGLKPKTEYTFCLLARNVEGEMTSTPLTFTTAALTAPKIEEEYATDVKSSSATLSAKVNPGGAEAGYRFEYGTGGEYKAVPGGEGIIAEGVTGVLVSVHMQGLLSSTEYHYRVVATNTVGSTGAGAGEDHIITTQSAGTEFGLPDGREWEMVSPPNKRGAGIEDFAEGGSVTQAAEEGGVFTYATSGPIASDPQGNRALEYTQVLSTRGPDGWESQDLNTPHEEVSKLTIGEFAEYKLFSSDLSFALLEPKGDTPLPPLPKGAEKTIYLRDNTHGSYLPLVTAANVPPGAKFGEEEGGNTVSFVGGTPDLSHIVFSSPEALTANAVAGRRSLYEWAEGKLQLVSLLPNKKPASEEETEAELGYRNDIVRHAISNDGTNVVWGTKSRELYFSDLETEETVQLEENEGGAVFQDASYDGSKVFFTDESQLTTNSQAEEDAPDLYVFEKPKSGALSAGTLTDLSVPINNNESADVLGTELGASEDGSYVYFVANGVLAHGATPGECGEPGSPPEATCNLYVAHYDEATEEWSPPKFIAELSNADKPSWDGRSKSPTNLSGLTSEVSPNGRFLAFMSSMNLTGYDNIDVNEATGRHADEEVYLYDANTERLVCASCNPTGARPAGAFDPPESGLLVDEPRNWAGEWLAGSVPGWTPVSNKYALYQSHYLSNDGRLFFDSADSLVPADINGKEDVYEYEPEGVGPGGDRCERGTSSASDTFNAAAGITNDAGGCVALISSGGSSEESVFLDASAKGTPGGEEGEDVFFLTTARLAPQDDDSAFDVYDAHVCSAASRCPAPVASVPPACNTAESCRAASTPQPAIFGASGSATFSGAGNILQQAPKPTVTAKRLTRAQKLAGALKACSKKPKKKRAMCTARARKTYGPTRKVKKSRKGGK
jgi:hypothetical protein